MGDIADLKGEIEKLSPVEQAEFRAWFLARDQDAWDAQIASDLQAGRLDAMIAEAFSERAAGKSRDL